MMIDIAKIGLKHTLGFFLAFVIYALSGAVIMNGLDVGAPSDPGVFSDSINLFLILLAQYSAVVLLYALIEGDRIRKYCYTALLYYVLVIFVMQMETYFFRDQINFSEKTAVLLFLFGLPLSLLMPIYLMAFSQSVSSIPLEKEIFEKGKVLPFLVFGAFFYVVVYMLAGYYLAWVHEEVRSFYGSHEELRAFHMHVLHLIKDQPSIFLLQLARGLVWSVCVFFVLKEMHSWALWKCLLAVMFLIAIPQNIAHIGQNPVMTDADVRLIHMIETVSSMLIYGAILTLVFRCWVQKERF